MAPMLKASIRRLRVLSKFSTMFIRRRGGKDGSFASVERPAIYLPHFLNAGCFIGYFANSGEVAPHGKTEKGEHRPCRAQRSVQRTDLAREDCWSSQGILTGSGDCRSGTDN